MREIEGRNRADDVGFLVLVEREEEGSIDAAAVKEKIQGTWEEADGLGTADVNVEHVTCAGVEAKGGCERDEEEDIEVHEMVVVVVEVFKWLGFW